MSIAPFTFIDARADLARFGELAGPWKPAGFNAECDLRLDYYVDRQLDDTLAELKKAFPHTHGEMTPVMLPITRKFIDERARVFLEDSSFDLFGAKGDKLPADGDAARWWSRLQRDMGLAFRLKQVDRYTTLHRTCFLRIARVGERLAAQIFFANRVDAVFDPAFPFDLDRAYAVRLEVGSDPGSPVLGANGQPAQQATKLFEFYCGREENQLYALVRSDGRTERRDPNPFGTIVPIVMFTAHTEELGPFTRAGQGLHLANRALNLALSDEQHIARCQGYGQFFIESPLGQGEPTARAPGTLVAGPSKIVTVPEGSTMKVLNGNAPIADLLARVDASIKRAAMAHDIPPGSVSLEARAVASGIALQIELRPLLEVRTDAIQVYAAPVSRLWTVLRAVHNGTRQQGETEIGGEIEMRWRPGDVQMPADPHIELDDIVIQLEKDLMTRGEAIAKLRKLPLDEAKKEAERIAQENAAARSQRAPALPGASPPPVTAGAKGKLVPPGGQRREGAAAEPNGGG